MFRDWRQRHVAPPEWVAWELWVYIPGSDLGWWHRPSLIVQSSAQIRTRILAIRENIGSVGCILWSLRGNEVAFNCVSSVKCSWSWPLSWLSLLFSIFAAREGLANCRRNQLVSRLMVKCWVHRCFLTELISWLLLQCETRSLSPNVTNCLPSCKTVKVCD